MTSRQVLAGVALGILLLPSLAAGGAGDTENFEASDKKVFNVQSYGAVADDDGDDTKAFSACLKAIVEAGGGRMYLPEGIYRGTIEIPPVSRPVATWLTIEIVGESEPTPVFGTISSFPLSKQGVIVVGTAKQGSVIAVKGSGDPLYGGFSAVNVVVRNLDIRTSDDPVMGGIDLYHAIQCKLENVFINTGVYNVQASQPTHATCGLVTPACNNGALTVLRNVVVTGYHTGIRVNEHTDADNIVVASNVYGLDFVEAYHASRFARVGAYRNTHHVNVSGRHGFSIEQLNTEMPGVGQTDEKSAWQTLVSDLNDPKNLGIGDINYWVVLGGTGAVEQFIVKGGESIRARRVGSK